MIEVHSRLYVGDQWDERRVRGSKDWYIISAAKEPYHRQALNYTTRAAPKDHPEYLVARRDENLILNLVDSDDVAYIKDEIVDVAVDEITKQISQKNVLVHCNEGRSRAPTLAFVYLLRSGKMKARSWDELLLKCRKVYPSYIPKKGCEDYLRKQWEEMR